MEGVRVAYSVDMQHVSYIVATTASVAFVCSWGLRWKVSREPSEELRKIWRL